MKNNEISYKLCTDYEKLIRLLKMGYIVIGFCAVSINRISKTHSQLIKMKYYDIGAFDLDILFVFQDDIKGHDDFRKICEEHNIRFIEPTL